MGFNMANGEWLTQLMAGLGGAFTGATQARERMSQETERKRLMDEQQAMREALAKMYERQPSPAELGMGARMGIPAATLSGIQRLYEPPPEKEAKPTMTVEPYMGGTARMKDGVFDSWVIRPPQEREAPTGTTPSDIRTARSELRGAESAFRATMGQRPRQRQFVDPVSGLPDKPAFEQAMQNWRADSTYAAGRRQQASEELEGLTGRRSGAAATGGLAANAALQQQVAGEMQRVIQAIMADPTLSEAEKRNRVQRVNERASSLLRNR